MQQNCRFTNLKSITEGGCVRVKYQGDRKGPRRDRVELKKICHLQITQCHLRHSPRPRTPMGGDGVANGDCVCVLTLPQLKREPIDTDSGGNDRQRAATLGQCTDLGFRINAEDRAVLFWVSSGFPWLWPRCVSGSYTHGLNLLRRPAVEE